LNNAAAHGLGRLPQFDERSRNYPIRALAPATLSPRSYTWKCPIVLDQGAEGSCVGFAFAGELAARPAPWPSTFYIGRLIYKEAQKIDEWPGEAYEGTSILAGVKVVRDMGFYKEFRWAFGLEDLILALGYFGPVVVGTAWYEDMFDPDADGLLHVGGQVAGGHGYLINGVSLKTRRFRIHNSWGPNWSLNGEAFISFDDMSRLLSEEGEACIPVRN
jgi:hypothetical protein